MKVNFDVLCEKKIRCDLKERDTNGNNMRLNIARCLSRMQNENMLNSNNIDSKVQNNCIVNNSYISKN